MTPPNHHNSTALYEIDAEIQSVLSDFSASTWLKKALTDCLQRDPLDAQYDAGALMDLMGRRATALLGGRDQ